MKKQKTALVLSAGGMFGAYQAGAWKVLSEQIEIDMVVGASVGAVNGWSIAGGCSADELISNWRDPITGQALKFFDSRPLRVMADRLHARYTPRIPYGLVVLEVAGLKTRLVQHPDVGPEHIHAACAIPFVLPSVKIGGKRFVDGGVMAKLPIFAAVEMGATRVIAIDVLPEFGKWRKYPFDIDLTVLSPSQPLGGIRDLFYWKRDLVERWIALGLRDAAALCISQAETPVLTD